MTDKQKIADRIRALLAKTVANGCTEAEAMAAAELAGRLMDKYQLSMSDVELGAEEVSSSTVRTDRREVGPMDIIADAIGEYCGVKTWYSDDTGRVDRHFFGLRVDVELSEWLYSMLGAAIRHDWIAYSFATMIRPHRRESDRRRFERGFADRVASRLRTMAGERRDEAKEATGRDLVVVKNAVVEGAFQALGICLVDGEAPRAVAANGAYAAGVAAGDRVQLGRSVDRREPLLIGR